MESFEKGRAEYIAKIDLSLQQHEKGEVVNMTFTEWEEWIKIEFNDFAWRM